MVPGNDQEMVARTERPRTPIRASATHKGGTGGRGTNTAGGSEAGSLAKTDPSRHEQPRDSSFVRKPIGRAAADAKLDYEGLEALPRT